MGDPPADNETGTGSGRESNGGVPAWVKVAAAIGIVIVLVVIAVLIFGGGPGNHGPGRHISGAGPAIETASGAALGDAAGSDASRGRPGYPGLRDGSRPRRP